MNPRIALAQTFTNVCDIEDHAFNPHGLTVNFSLTLILVNLRQFTFCAVNTKDRLTDLMIDVDVCAYSYVNDRS